MRVAALRRTHRWALPKRKLSLCNSGTLLVQVHVPCHGIEMTFGIGHCILPLLSEGMQTSLMLLGSSSTVEASMRL